MQTLRRPLLIPFVVASLALLIAAPRAGAVWGAVDTSFAAPAGYTQSFPAGNTYGLLSATLVQPDGKIIVAGRGGVDFFGFSAMFQRFMPDGSPDPSFGVGGTTILHTPAAMDGSQVNAMALQSDGRVLAVGRTISGSGRLFRMTSTGALDTTFAAPNGYLSFANEEPTDVMIGAGGTIYTAANGSSNTKVLRAFGGDGAQVGSFATNASAALSSSSFYGNDDVLLRPSGSGLIMVTTGLVSATPVFYAAKFDSAGNLVSGWGSAGERTIGGFSLGVVAEAALVQPTGALVIGGRTENMGDTAWTFARLDAGGTLDPTWSGGGKTELDFSPGKGEGVNDLVALPDGTLIAGGNVTSASDVDLGTLRAMDANGNPLEAFGSGGLRQFGLTPSVLFSALAIQNDNRIVAAGYTHAPSPGNETLPLTVRFDDASAPVPSAKISTPKKSKTSAKKLTKFAGTASSNKGTVTKVEVALQRVDTKLLKKKKRCIWLSGNKAKFKQNKAVKKKCSKQRWLKASGTTSWTYKLKRKLPKGKYVLSVRATSIDGSVRVVQSKPTVKKFKVT